VTIFDADQFDRGFNKFTFSIVEEKFRTQLEITAPSGQASGQGKAKVLI
jgi:hypothetical protein